MNVSMADRIRMIIETDEELRLAVKLRCVREDVSISELVNRILRSALADELQDAKKYAKKSKRKGGAE